MNAAEIRSMVLPSGGNSIAFGLEILQEIAAQLADLNETLRKIAPNDVVHTWLAGRSL